MCGIIGLVYKKPIISPLLKALERLEYRGYDSSGIVVLDSQGSLVRYRSVGMLSELKKHIPPLEAEVGIGHTRWATHGAPHESNAHPLMSHHIAVVHNGIIENFSPLKKKLLAQGYVFESETDTEVIAHLLDFYYTLYNKDIKKTFLEVLPQLEGNFAIACLIKETPQKIITARKGSSPLVLGKGPDGWMVSSDVLGCAGLADHVYYMENNQWGYIEGEKIHTYTFSGVPVILPAHTNPFTHVAMDRGSFEHYMLKEIHEQSKIITHLAGQPLINLDALSPLGMPAHLTLLGCGTSFYAAWVGKYFLEHICPVTLELASEFHYRSPVMLPGMTMALSQSGETADTLKAMEYAKSQSQTLCSIVNIPYSSIARLSDHVIETHAGPEIGVASTKSFMAQLWILMMLAGRVGPQTHGLPQMMEHTLLLIPAIQNLAKDIAHATSILYLGRGPSYPLALEGALKMKELAYIHAEGIAAGELKHGPIALIDRSVPVIVLAPYDNVFDKTVSNLHEIAARQGRLWVITDEKGVLDLGLSASCETLVLPSPPNDVFFPFLSALILQLIAYYTALYRGCSIDKPRNLAKSVTVE